MLDAVEQMLEAVSPPSIARRLPAPLVEQYDVTVVHDGHRHYLFLSAEVDPTHRVLRVLRIGVVIKPA